MDFWGKMQAVGNGDWGGGEGEVKLGSKEIAEVLSEFRKPWRQARNLPKGKKLHLS